MTAAAPLYIDGVKIGEVTGGSYDVTNGVERVVTSDAVALTSGKVVTGVQFKTVIPRAGMGKKLFQEVINKRILKIQLPIDGDFHEVEGMLTSAKADWDQAAGRTDGDFSFVGGTPEIV